LEDEKLRKRPDGKELRIKEFRSKLRVKYIPRISWGKKERTSERGDARLTFR